MQCAIVIAAAWGVIAFREITNKRAIAILTVSATVVMGGAICLALSKNN